MANFTGGSGADTYNGTSGNDSISGLGGDDELRGGAGADRISGGGGNDVLNGGSGVDYMRGGGGNDRYFIFSDGEDVREEINSGTDTVLAGISYTLEENFENLTLLGDARTSINGIGNAGNNLMLGSAGTNVLDGAGGNDSLNGGEGNDVLIGGTGNDRYLLNSSGDVAFEASANLAGGTDTVLSLITYRAAFGIENVNLRGDENLSAFGNGLANTLVGNGGNNALNGGGGADVLRGNAGVDRLAGGAGADRLAGGAGADRLSGGSGADDFRFMGRNEAGDTITDFRTGDDFEISARGFGGGLVAGGTLAGTRFVVRANDNQAQDGDDRFIFRESDDTLWFDANGSRAGGSILVADLDAGATVTSEDIFLI